MPVTDPSEGAPDAPAGGWDFVADSDGAARLLDALVDLDDDETVTRTEIAERAGVPLKTLYLNGLLADCVDLGLLAEAGTAGSETDGEGETQYRVVGDSDILAAAAAFDDAVRTQRE